MWREEKWKVSRLKNCFQYKEQHGVVLVVGSSGHFGRVGCSCTMGHQSLEMWRWWLAVGRSVSVCLAVVGRTRWTKSSVDDDVYGLVRLVGPLAARRAMCLNESSSTSSGFQCTWELPLYRWIAGKSEFSVSRIVLIFWSSSNHG